MQIHWLKVIAVVSLLETAVAGTIPHRKRRLWDRVRTSLQTVALTCYPKADSINITGIPDVYSERCLPVAGRLPVRTGRRDCLVTAV
jgi:hypothetical protein